LYVDLVRDKRISLGVQAVPSFPGGKYPNLFILFDVPAAGHTIEENEKELYVNVERLKQEKVDDVTLQRVKTKIRAGLIRQLDSNSGLAAQLPMYEVMYGNWRVMFTGLQDIEKVTAEDVQRVARTYFTPANRTVVFTVKQAAADSSKKGAEVEK